MRRNPDNPSTTFFWNDWDNEPGMKFCSLAAQGLWVKMLSLAARSREYGVVLVGDHASLREDLPALLAPSCGETVEVIDRLIADLITFKVASIDQRGRVYNRRMVAEASLSEARSSAGRAGAEATNRRRQTSGKGVGKQGGKRDGKGGGKSQRRAAARNAGQQALFRGASPDDDRQTGGKNSGKPSASSFFNLSSVSKDTARGGAQADPAKVTFGDCLAYLVESGKTEKSARALLGRWRRDHGDEAVHRAVEQARRQKVSEPGAYIGRCLSNNAQDRQARPSSAWEAQV